MNTHLHLLEAYTNLLEVWPNRGLQIKIRELIKIMLDKILDAKNRLPRCPPKKPWELVSQGFPFWLKYFLVLILVLNR